ncbi:ATP citrate lyase, subunit 1, putative [Talaromyces stipitatus ATCC 10500]|uniref:ATP citrate synthase n=1 Tax=Talaromyces stipitatus (strain ATCC 10500 / CBS 375.48 / QM 6759 / NRRL 1006) TaxID=441959 RepID=B8MQ83_TALSN|nr:ATP citrate lyase, subunit 1, putative [Talaromyces stipitatus ATCC 10500]EED13151.1 ATP citrate lyase, subunit 1, putative [Talaromyces stipitatus ATCC 10500]
MPSLAPSNGVQSANDNITRFNPPSRLRSPLEQHTLFHPKTRCFVYGMQPRAVQGMLDFDFICKRSTPSVAGIIYTFGGQFVSKMYWGTSETLLPVYQDVEKAFAKHSDVDTVVNFASSRSVYSSTMELMEIPQVRTIAIIAEGVPERRAREIMVVAKEKGITIIGPATVGGIKPGAFKIGNTGGMMDNIVASKLYRKGSVGYVSKSGGMSNELNNIICQNADGVHEGVAIGGDRYPGTTFIDHLLRYQADPECKILLLLGEVGGVEEYRVIEAVKNGTITKPIVAWAIGTCASMFKTEVQFGHAGASANSQLETAVEKNKHMRAAGFYVPDTFEELPQVLNDLYKKLVADGTIATFKEPVIPKIPMDYSWAQELGLIRKPAAFISTISDDRGQELLYAGMPISDVFREDIGIGGVMSLLWFRRRLPPYASKFLEMVLMLTADHGPAVSGAMNTIITTRAGKDLISALVSGLLTIGSRFGGALDGAAEEFTKAFDKGLSPREFVDTMRKENKLIPGIGHKVKSRNNPDLRVELVKEYVTKNFPTHKLLDYAIAVETVTTSKKDNLILNVDGCVAVCFVDLLRNSGAFSAEEAEDYLKMGVLNGLFVLGRSIGLIAHYLDQKRLRTGLYRHPWDDITYLLPNISKGAPGAEGRVEVSL